jgi:hypothetical protein
MSNMSRAPRRRRLSDRDKAIAAALVLLDVQQGRLSDEDAATQLHAELGPHWSFLTCIQFLSGKRAIAGLTALPDDWRFADRRKSDLLQAVVAAAHAVGHALPDGTTLCASALARELKTVTKAL